MPETPTASHQQVIDAFAPEDRKWVQRALMRSVGTYGVKVPVVHSRLQAVARRIADGDGTRVIDVMGSADEWAESLARDVRADEKNLSWPIMVNPRSKARIVALGGVIAAVGMCLAGFVFNAGQASMAGVATPAVAMVLIGAGVVATTRVFTLVRRPWGPLFAAAVGMASVFVASLFGVYAHVERIGGVVPVSLGWCGVAWTIVGAVLFAVVGRLPSAPARDWADGKLWQQHAVATLIAGCGVNPPIAKEIVAEAVSSADGRPLVDQLGSPLEFAHSASHGHRRDVGDLIQSALLVVTLPVVAVWTATDLVEDPSRIEAYVMCAGATIGTVWLLLDRGRTFLRENAPRRLSDVDGD